MNRLVDVLRLRLRSLFRRDAADGELDRELRFHLEEHIAELTAFGLSPEEARRRALQEFGSVASVTEQCREARGFTVISHLAQDLRYAVRGLIAQPMLFTAATLSIALGIGANLAIFGLANALLLSTPSAADPERLVHIRTGNGSHAPYVAWQRFDESRVLAGIAGHQIESNVNWRGPEISVPIAPLIVSPNFFDVIGVPMTIGRGFTAAEAARDPRVAVVSHGFWARHLGGGDSVLGSSLVLNGESYTVVGVTRKALRSLPGYGIVPDVWLPVTRALIPNLDSPRDGHLQLVGRLSEGQDRNEAHAALSTIASRLGTELGQPDVGRISPLTPAGGFNQMREFKAVAAFFAVLLVVTILVLAIACGNVAGLLLARGTARSREIAVRLALGASRGRLVQQLLTEGFVLSATGTLVGLAVLTALAQLLPQIRLPLPLPLELHITFDTRLAWFSTGLIVISALMCGLAPAWHASRPTIVPALKHVVPMYVHRRFTFRNLLVGGQITVSTLLLVTTLLFLRNLTLAHTLSPEFDADRALVAQVTFVEGRQGVQAPAVESIVERLSAVAGIEAAAFSDGVPLTMYTSRTGTTMRIDGREQPVRVDYEGNTVSPGYFRAMGIELLRGRDFRPADRRGSPLVVIVNQEFVRRYFEGRNPLGLHVFLPTDPAPTPAEVVGVVADSKYRSIGEGRVPALYGAYLQRSGIERFVHVIVRTSSLPETMIDMVRQNILQMDGSAAVTVEPLTSAVAFAFLPSRIGAALMGLLGTLGAVLAMVGLYGVVAFAVTRRTSEIGIRLALGAPRSAVLRLVLSDSTLLVGMGLLVGLAAALVLTRPLAAFLVAELPPYDAISFVGSAVLLLATSLVASWNPARRAARIAPAITLRAE